MAGLSEPKTISALVGSLPLALQEKQVSPSTDVKGLVPGLAILGAGGDMIGEGVYDHTVQARTRACN